MNALLLIAVSGAACLLLAGLALVWVGLKGRMLNDHPTCRRCRFDLVGLAQPARCPECGAELTGHAAIRVGQRARRTGALAFGCALLLVLATAGAGVGWAQAKGYDWNKSKPVWLLVRDGEGFNDAKADAALKELLRRQNGKTLSSAQMADLRRAALRFQADTARPWRSYWGDLIEGQQIAGVLGDEDIVAYARHAVVPDLRVRARLRVGLPVPAVLLLRTRVGTNRLMACEATRVSVKIGDARIQTGTSGTTFSLQSAGASPVPFDFSVQSVRLSPDDFSELSHRPDASVQQKAGEIVVRSEWRIHVGIASWNPDQNKYVFEHAGTTWTDLQDRAVQVVPPESSTVELVRDPSIREGVRTAISVSITSEHARYVWPENKAPALIREDGVKVQDSASWFDVRSQLYARGAQIPLAFDIVLRKGNLEWWGGRVHSEYLGGSDFRNSDAVAQIPDLTETNVDVVLRPSQEAAERSTGITRIWGEEIVIKNVPVRPPQRGP